MPTVLVAGISSLKLTAKIADPVDLDISTIQQREVLKVPLPALALHAGCGLRIDMGLELKITSPWHGQLSGTAACLLSISKLVDVRLQTAEGCTNAEFVVRVKINGTKNACCSLPCLSSRLRKPIAIANQ